MDLLDITIELWDIILSNLCLTLSCQRFKDIVEQSSEAMNKICLVLNKKNFESVTLEQSQRKYQNIVMYDLSGMTSSLKGFLSNQKNIKTVKVSNCSMTVHDIGLIQSLQTCTL